LSEEAQQPATADASDIAIPEEIVPAALDPLAQFNIEIPSSAPVIPANRSLDIGGSVALVLDVAYIDRAEAFYHDVFEMDVVCRAWRQDDGSWVATTEPINWGACMLDGYYPELVVLERPGWRMVLHGMGRGQVLTSPKAGDVRVPLSPAAMRRLRARLLMRSYTVVHDEPDSFAFRDPFAIVWTLVSDESLTPAG
jgi:catechol 2,3-dioxygenase-like lactoylglutathione lyase family enzyme